MTIQTVITRQKEAVRTTQNSSVKVRIQLLEKLALFLHENESALIDTLNKDLGRCWLEAWTAEIGLVQADIAHVIKNLRKWNRKKRFPTSPAQKPGKAYVNRSPFGSVLIISPWNYPVQLLLSPAVAAIAAGNRVILKPSDRSSHTEKLFAEQLPRYFSEDELYLSTDDVATVRSIIQNDVDFVCFTGSTAIGRSVMADASMQPIPVLLELGGVNPVYVGSGINYDESAKRICWGKFFNTGQTCLAPNQIYVEPHNEEAITSALIKSILSFYGEKPDQSQDYGRLIDQRACDEMKEVIDQGEIVHGGVIDKENRYVSPTLLKVPSDSPLLQREIFGPILLITTVDSLESIIDTSSWNESPLVIYGFGDNNLQRRIVHSTRSGSVMFNGTIHRVVSTVQPFGGVGTSGIGNYRGEAGFKTFSYERVIVDKHYLWEMPQLTPPYTISQRLVRWLGKYL